MLEQKVIPDVKLTPRALENLVKQAEAGITEELRKVDLSDLEDANEVILRFPMTLEVVYTVGEIRSALEHVQYGRPRLGRRH